jgi:hypothetical protein
VAFKKRAGTIWSVSTFSKGKGTQVDVRLIKGIILDKNKKALLPKEASKAFMFIVHFITPNLPPRALQANNNV